MKFDEWKRSLLEDSWKKTGQTSLTVIQANRNGARFDMLCDEGWVHVGYITVHWVSPYGFMRYYGERTGGPMLDKEWFLTFTVTEWIRRSKLLESIKTRERMIIRIFPEKQHGKLFETLIPGATLFFETKGLEQFGPNRFACVGVPADITDPYFVSKLTEREQQEVTTTLVRNRLQGAKSGRA